MSKDKDFAAAYILNIETTLQKGYAEECTVGYEMLSKTSCKYWYLPHFAVYHPRKNKLRVVHDAAAKTEGVSLNSLLVAGPDLLQSLVGILFRWREGKVALLADIREMFPQIKIRDCDRDMQRFLWRDHGDRSKPIKEYRMSSMIFGAASSPCTAIYVLNKNAEEHSHIYRDAATATHKNTYMDDYVGSVASIEHAAQLGSDIIALHKLGHFEMRGWVSNFPEALKLVSPDLRALPSPSGVPVGIIPNTQVRTLGLTWNTETDMLSFRSDLTVEANSLCDNPVITKRSILSCVMRLYDPLGLLSPISVHGRILLQNAWRLKVDWDQPLPNDQCKEWEIWLHRVTYIAGLRISRWYLDTDFENIECELHVFADASELAYACIAYWRFRSTGGNVRLALIAGKARVAPLTYTSIPRLELQAALLAVRLATTIIAEHEMKPIRRQFWTDSMNVLGWLRTEARTLKPFVANRVGEISEDSDISEWRWVHTHLNVADDATRPGEGVPSRWLDGPSFLLGPPETWPSEVSTDTVGNNKDYIREFRSKEATNVNVLTGEMPHPLVLLVPVAADPTRFSDWLRMVRATARAHQFARLLRNQINSKFGSDRSCEGNIRNRSPSSCVTTPSPSFLTCSDLSIAENHIFRRSQMESFELELQCLKSSASVNRHSRLLRLSPYLDSSGLIRLAGRITAVDGVPETMKRPIVLAGRHPTARLLVAYYHRKAAHGFNDTVINEIRQKYWILGLRGLIRSISRNCLICTLRRCKTENPPMGDLPRERLAHHRRPFSYVGLDYMGPVQVAVGRRREKRWIALFTCMTTRAVHLEIVGSLSADAAVMCLRLFTSRRGTPVEIMSDNGTSFVGANNLLTRAYNEEMDQACTARGIEWRFIPPSAPHMGGAWERMVGCVKRALNATLKERAPKEELLQTVLLEAEALVNSRPLTHLATEPDAPEALTPFHFILGSASPYNALPKNVNDRDLISRSDWRKSQRLADFFWTRWVQEYLPTLQPRSAGGRGTQMLSVGDLVMIVDGNMPRGTWPRGRIEKVFPGADGIVRVAEVATDGGSLRRPARKLLKLPVTPHL